MACTPRRGLPQWETSLHYRPVETRPSPFGNLDGRGISATLRGPSLLALHVAVIVSMNND